MLWVAIMHRNSKCGHKWLYFKDRLVHIIKKRLLSPDNHLAIGHATGDKNTVGMPGIDGRDRGQVAGILEVSHQITCTTRINVDRLVHVANGEPIELGRPDGAEHGHPAATPIIMTDPYRLRNLLHIRQRRVKIVKDADVVVIRRARDTYTCGMHGWNNEC